LPANGALTRRQWLVSSVGAAAMISRCGLQVAASSAERAELIPTWDAHTHLQVGAPASVPQRVANLLKYADRMAIERIVACMGRDFVRHPTPEKFRRDNDDVLEAIACAPRRVMGFAYLNP